MDNQELQKDYKKLYEAEREKSEVLVSKIEECEKEIASLRSQRFSVPGARPLFSAEGGARKENCGKSASDPSFCVFSSFVISSFL